VQADFLNTLGLTTWQARPGYFAKSVPRTEPAANSISLEAEAMTAAPNTESEVNSVVSEAEMASAPVETPAPKAAFVLVGAGLDDIWQNESAVQWALMLNILKAFGLSEEQLRFFDTAHAVTDEAVFASIEEVIDLGVETVFAFEESSPLIEQLEEGVQVVFLPSLDEMMQRGQAKRETFEILSHVISA
jgi:predicted RNase H-like HicB family nuclease